MCSDLKFLKLGKFFFLLLNGDLAFRNIQLFSAAWKGFPNCTQPYSWVCVVSVVKRPMIVCF